MRGVLAAAALMAIVVFGARLLLVAQDVPATARLAILVALGVLTFVPLCARGAGEVVTEVRALLQQIGRSHRVAPKPAH
jgi:hypothetical protein